MADYPPSTLVVRVVGHTQEHFTSWRRANDPDWIVESDPMKVIGFKRQALGQATAGVSGSDRMDGYQQESSRKITAPVGDAGEQA